MHYRITLLFVLALLLAFSASAAETPVEDERPAALVTGASTGLGRAMAERLAAEGYVVYAGARKQRDLDALNAIENIVAVRLDVTVQSEIDAAVKLVEAEGRGLHALINNAGVLITGPSAEAEIDDVKWLFDVNVYGVMRMTTAFAPLLTESGGRIVNIGSIAGSVGFGFLGPYSMSKHAMEAYTEALHAEMEPLGVGVSVVKPGDYTSNIWAAESAEVKKRLAAMEANGSPHFDAYRQWLEQTFEQGDPFDVAEVVAQALTDQPMAKRYLIVPNETEMGWVMNNLVDRLADLNRNNVYAWAPDRIGDEVAAAIARKKAQGQ